MLCKKSYTLLFQDGSSKNLLAEELDIWSKAYIDVDEIVRQNIVLRNEVKSLTEKCAGLERGRLKSEPDLPRDLYRCVEGSSDQESNEDSIRDGEIVGNRKSMVRSRQTAIISCKSEYSHPPLDREDEHGCTKTEKPHKHKVTRI